MDHFGPFWMGTHTKITERNEEGRCRDKESAHDGHYIFIKHSKHAQTTEKRGSFLLLHEG